jgi:cell division protein FtsQ
VTSQADLLDRAQRQFARRQRAVRRRGRLPWLVGILVVLLVGAGVWLVYVSSLLAVSSVEVRGVHSVPRPTVLQTARVPIGEPLVRVDTERIAQRVRGITAVADARVSRSWPDRVVITVIERVPVATVTDGSNYQLVDATGVTVRTVSRKPGDLPVALVTGPRRDVTIRSVVTVSAALPADLRHRVMSIAAGSPDSITLHLDGGVKVVWGSAEQSDRKAAVLAALMHRKATEYDVSAPDLPVTQGEKP